MSITGWILRLLPHFGNKEASHITLEASHVAYDSNSVVAWDQWCSMVLTASCVLRNSLSVICLSCVLEKEICRHKHLQGVSLSGQCALCAHSSQ